MHGNTQEPELVKSFRTWLVKHGGSLHEGVYFQQDATGLSIHAAQDLPPDTTVASCPFPLAITIATTHAPLATFCHLPLDEQRQLLLSERQLICTYIALHWMVPEDEDTESLLRHRPYVDLLPCAEALRTPLYFTKAELDMLRGTNMYSAALDQRAAWKAEWCALVAGVRPRAPELAERFTWPMYLAAATYLSSRAFPSTLLSATPSLVANESSYPVLLPAIDALNHARGQAVTWEVGQNQPSSSASPLPETVGSTATKTLESDLCISLVLNTRSLAGQELFNNYGPKPNASFLLGYGFTLPDNSDDTVLLKVGSAGAPGPVANENEEEPKVKQEEARSIFEVGRGAKGAEALWEDVRARVVLGFRDDEEEEEEDDDDTRLANALQLDLETADALSSMLASRLTRLPSLSRPLLRSHDGNPSPDPTPPPTNTNANTFAHANATAVRPEVETMWTHYVRGQADILRDLAGWVDERRGAVLERAREAGIGVAVLDEEEEEGAGQYS